MVLPLREDPFTLTPPPFGHCPFGGGGLNACPDGLGHLFREELSKFKWAYPCFLGGSKRLPRWFGALIQRRIVEVQMSISLFLRGSKPGVSINSKNGVFL